ncbi:hypothetical protein ANN_21274, partial [Periplaneta americana]
LFFLTDPTVRISHNKDVNKLLLHDNARSHTSLYTREEITKLLRTVLPQTSYSPDFAPSDFYLFEPLKDAICGKRCGNDQETVEWYREDVQGLESRWRKAIDLNRDYVEKWVYITKDLSNKAMYFKLE